MLKEMFKKSKYIFLNGYDEENKEINSENQTDKVEKKVNDIIHNENLEKGPAIPNGTWIKCDNCGETLYNQDVKENMRCCPKCNKHFRISASRRIRYIVDKDSFVEWDKHKSAKNVLNFPNYEEKIKDLQIKTGMLDSVITGRGKINGYSCVIAAMDSSFLMGSMGQVVGEKITKAVERATKEKLPVIIFSTSGGARMQEGMVSLMQMAKTSAAIKRHSDLGLLYISVLTDPTTGGVTASFAMLGDIIISEPNALIGFAGPRVIEQTIGQKLPEGFQRAEFLLEKGFIDMIVDRKNMKNELGKLLKMHKC